MSTRSRLYSTRPGTPRFLAVVALTGALVVTCAQERDARADDATDILKQVYDPTSFITTFNDAFTLYENLNTLFGGGGPSTADLINKAVTDLENYMSTQRDLQWKSTTVTAFNNLKALAHHQPSDPTNPNLYQSIWDGMGGSIDSMYTILVAANDPRSSYETAPVLNELASGWIGLLTMKGQIWPSYPSPWGDFQTRLQEVMDLDYRMIGARQFMCYPYFNPWYGGYTPANAFNGYFTDSRDTYASQFYKNMATLNYYYSTGVTYTGYQYPCGNFTLTPYCSPAGICTGTPVSGCYAGIPRSVYPTAAYLQTVRDIFAAQVFDKDPVVKIVRASMVWLMDVGGGDDPADYDNVDLPKTDGVFIDPWVWESTNCNAFWQSAYPMVP